MPLLAYGTAYQLTLSPHSRWPLQGTAKNICVQTVMPMTTVDFLTCLCSIYRLKTYLLTYLLTTIV